MQNVAEARAIKRIATVWFLVFLLACFTLRAISPGSFAVESFAIAMTCVGLTMAVSWTCLYGDFSLRRLLIYLCLVAATTVVGFLVAERRARLTDCLMMLTVLTFAAVVALLPFLALRRFVGLRFTHVDDPPSDERESQFTIVQAMTWTAFWAVVFSLGKWVASFVFGSDVSGFLQFVFLGIVLPISISVVYFGLLTKLTIRQLIVATPLFALLIAVALTIYFVMAGEFGEKYMEWIFWPNLIWLTFAGWVLTAAVWSLRNEGFFFVSGKTATCDAAGVQRLRTARLRDHINRAEWQRRQLSRLSSWLRRVERRLSNQQTRLEQELAVLPKAVLDDSNVGEQPLDTHH